jgi:hypothetical protein
MIKRLGWVLGFVLVLPATVVVNGPAPAGAQAAGPGGGVEVTTVKYGPFVLPPAGKGGDVDHANVVVPDVARPCEDCFILRAEPDLVYDDGSSANLDTGLMLHHAVFFNTGRADATCGKDTFFGRLGERFLASGNERTVKRYPDGYGYHLGHDPVTGVFHIMNHSDATKRVWFTFKVNWLPDSTAGVRAVTPLWLDENNCRSSEYDVPAGPTARHWTWTSTRTGRIVSGGGHVHTGGVRTVLTNATTGQHICTSWAGYGHKPAYMGEIESMSYCAWDTLGVVRAGDTLDLEADYDSAEPVPEAMGIMVMGLYETNDLTAGTPAPPEASGAKMPPSAGSPPPAGDMHHGHHH